MTEHQLIRKLWSEGWVTKFYTRDFTVLEKDTMTLMVPVRATEEDIKGICKMVGIESKTE